MTKNQKGFTLIEAIFSTLVASVVIGFVYSFFSQSTKGISHSEAANQSIRELQLLSNSIRQDLFHLEPFIDIAFIKGGKPKLQRTFSSLELWNRNPTFPNLIKYYPPHVFIDTLSGGVLKKNLKPSKRKHTYDISKNSIRFYKPSIQITDGWFFGKQVKYGADIYGLQDALIHIKRKIEKPISASVSEFYIYSKGRRLVYRHYLKDSDDKDLNYIEYLEDLPTKRRKEILIKTYGKSSDGTGLIDSFEIKPYFEFSYYKNDLSQNILEFKKIYTKVSINMKIKIRDKISKQSNYNLTFNVVNPNVANRQRHKGQFLRFDNKFK
ncbi:MAG: hypothetical protein COB02_10075 [Candidatus Cloacimonadota bacterium]|nr:MAG: hypothetical protein COB02_10075 [Candidatus Cloacimonadota bacterium]